MMNCTLAPRGKYYWTIVRGAAMSGRGGDPAFSQISFDMQSSSFSYFLLLFSVSVGWEE